ncbi:MAG: hypothetical protein VKL60_21785 [Sphaerospermopsis sp.]|nr:hypothetical protein [Sphaerospermopsis sp.]
MRSRSNLQNWKSDRTDNPTEEKRSHSQPITPEKRSLSTTYTPEKRSLM